MMVAFLRILEEPMLREQSEGECVQTIINIKKPDTAK